MSNVVRFPGHRLYRCGPECRGCWCCEGGLALCTVCGGAEDSLPTHCPGARMDSVMEASVQMGVADFRDGEWWYRGLRRRDVQRLTGGNSDQMIVDDPFKDGGR